MARTLDSVLDALPKARRDRIEARYQALKTEVESLQALRKAVGKAQVEVATTLHISQPSVSKIEKQTDMYISTLRNYVAAIGGDLDLVVRFPQQSPIYLNSLGEIAELGPTHPRLRRSEKTHMSTKRRA